MKVEIALNPPIFLEYNYYYLKKKSLGHPILFLFLHFNGMLEIIIIIIINLIEF